MKAPDVDYAVFDDIRGGMKFFPSFKEWLGAQMWITVKRLYREPKLEVGQAKHLASQF